MDGAEIIAPPQYSIAWTILAILCLLLAVAALVGLMMLSRWIVERAAWANRMRDEDAVKAEFLRSLSRLEERTGSEGLDPRAAHQELTALMRLFVRRTSGIDIDTEDTAALRQEPELEALADLFDRLAEPSFSAEPEQDVAESLRQAREVVRAW